MRIACPRCEDCPLDRQFDRDSLSTALLGWRSPNCFAASAALPDAEEPNKDDVSSDVILAWA